MDDLTAVAAAFAALIGIGGARDYLFQVAARSQAVVRHPLPRFQGDECRVRLAESRHRTGSTHSTRNWTRLSAYSTDLPCESVLAFVTSKLLGASAVARSGLGERPRRLSRRVERRAVPTSRQAGSRAHRDLEADAPSVPDDQIFGSGAVGSDRDGFLQWAYQNCRADHYALFYWGHSIGPGGLFELNTSVQFPPIPGATGLAPASLIDVGTTLQLLQDLRLSGQITQATQSKLRPPGSTGGTLHHRAERLPGRSRGSSDKVDVVLFQDCWMTTLETAFELQSLARYVVGSQSLVPIGYTYTGGTMTAPTGPVWPYEAMIARMLASPNDFIDAVAGDLRTFYDDAAARAPFPVSTVSVLDLGLGAEIQTIVRPPIQALVSALTSSTAPPTGALTPRCTGGYFWPEAVEAYVLDPINDTLQAGDWALRDVLRLCRYLRRAESPRGRPSGDRRDTGGGSSRAQRDCPESRGPVFAR